MYHHRPEPQVWLYQIPLSSKRIRLRELIISLMHKLDRHACQRTNHRVMDDAQPFPPDFSANRDHFTRVEQCLKRCHDAQFIGYLRFCLTIVTHQLQKTRKDKQSDRKVLFQKVVKEELLNLSALHLIWMDDERYSENVASFLSSGLPDHQVLTFSEVRFFHCRLSPQSLDFHSFPIFSRSRWCPRRSPLLNASDKKVKVVEIFFKRDIDKQLNERNPHALFDFGGTHCDRLWNKK